MKVKVCGMRDAANIRAVESLGIDMMGFIFYDKSKRFCAKMPDYLPMSCNRVGVFVNADIEYIKQQVADYRLDMVQLHGSETPNFCRSLGDIPLIKAISISSANDVAQAEQYDGIVRYMLFETKCSGYGGSGMQFDWNILHDYRGSSPFLLTGGIGPEDAERLNAYRHPQFAGIDLNSRFELSPGLKNVDELKQFLTTIRQKQ